MAEGSVQIAELAAQYHVSRETIRKDLIFLEQSGVGRRSRGGSLILEGIAEPPLSARSVENIAAKHRVAEAAVRQIPDGATILLDTGSTMNEVARLLALRHGLTIVTNSAQITPLLADSDNTVYALGGQVCATSLACVGMWTLTALRTLRADIALIGTNGVLGHTGPAPRSTARRRSRRLWSSARKKASCSATAANSGRKRSSSLPTGSRSTA